MSQKQSYETLFSRAEKGQKITIGLIGGSITQGAVATSHEKCFAYQLFCWFKERFLEADFRYINAGIGGTTSYYGVARVEDDLLFEKPDFVLVDFCVNDDVNCFSKETFEGLIRKLLQADSKPAILALNNIKYDSGMNEEERHSLVTDYYGIPCCNIRDSIWRDITAGTLQVSEITEDYLHPNDLGHELIAKQLIKILDLIYNKKLMCANFDTDFGERGKALSHNRFERIKRYDCTNLSPELVGFRADFREKEGASDWLANGWIGSQKQDKLMLTLETSSLAVLYRKTPKGPAMRASLVLDGKEEDAVLLDGSFPGGWGECIYLQPIFANKERRKHQVTIELRTKNGDEVMPFYLLALLAE